jgi:hypothetical protein
MTTPRNLQHILKLIETSYFLVEMLPARPGELIQLDLPGHPGFSD